MSSSSKRYRVKVGEVRPSQLLFSYGIGAVVDLPNISTMIMGLDDWDVTHAPVIGEERLLQAVQAELGSQVSRLLMPPALDSNLGSAGNPFDESARVGVPVAPFPRWMLCPQYECRLLAPLEAGLFKLTDENRPDRVRYAHLNCPGRKNGRAPTVLPARFMVGCKAGHLDDFAWVYFVHQEQTTCKYRLRLRELGVSGEAADVQVKCEECGKSRRMAEAFGEDAPRFLPPCRGRRPHLRDYAEEPCTEPSRTLLLGASNSWFGTTLSTLSVPQAPDRLGQLVDSYWHILEKTEAAQNVALLQQVGLLPHLATFPVDDIWKAIERKRNAGQEVEVVTAPDLKVPEWQILSQADLAGLPSNFPDFNVTNVPVPAGYTGFLSRVLQVNRLREVRALTGFTRIESPADYSDEPEALANFRVPLSRSQPRWVPAGEIRGEGLFLQFDEAALNEWLSAKGRREYDGQFREAYRKWRLARNLDPERGYLGLRYVLLHSFSHAVMRELVLECGYTAASIRERIYSRQPTDENGPMAGILIYTAAPDSEGTLGGLVEMGRTDQLKPLLDTALDNLRLCASDPLCAEHFSRNGQTLHAATCHACLFAPETACEKGNKYLDRSVLVPTIEKEHLAFFALSPSNYSDPTPDPSPGPPVDGEKKKKER